MVKKGGVGFYSVATTYRYRIFDEFLNVNAHRYVDEILNRMVSELMLSFAHMKSRFSHPAY